MSLQLNALPFVAAICCHLNKFISVLTHRETPLPLTLPQLLPSKVIRTHSACLSTLCVLVCVCNKSFLAAVVVVVVIGGGLSSGTPAVQIFIIVIFPSRSHSSFCALQLFSLLLLLSTINEWFYLCGRFVVLLACAAYSSPSSCCCCFVRFSSFWFPVDKLLS